jgi:predicted permease
VERGFPTDGLVAMRVAPDRATYPTGADLDRFARDLADGLDGIPGVTATAVNNLPLSGLISRTSLHIDRPTGDVDRMEAVLTVGLENYLDVLGIPLIQGRGFERGDTPEAAPVAVVSASLAHRAWPGERAVGKRFRTSEDWLASIEVVGVAADVRHEGLAAGAASTVYLPLSQSNRDTHEVILRVRGDIASAIQSARGTVATLSPTTPVRRVLVLDETIADSVAVPRFRTALVVGLAGLAGVLALLGVYGVVSFAVGQRTREVGVRMALGARSGSVVLRVSGGGLALGITGVGLGLLLALAVANVLEAFLFEITPTDPVTYLAVVVAVLVVCCIAAYVPARRAAAIDPVAVLKAE